MKKRLSGVLMMCLAVSCILCGCGVKDAIPAMTAQDSDLVATYAVDVIEAHNTITESRLVDTEAETVRRLEIAEKAAKVQALIDAQKQEEKQQLEAEKTETPVVDASSGNPVAEGNVYSDYSDEDMARLLGLDNFKIQYAGTLLTPEYPVNTSDEWVPTIEATVGKKLMVVVFSVTNISDETAMFDTLSRNIQGRISSSSGNGGIALTTMLLNDFAGAADYLNPGESGEYVLVTQVDGSVTEAGRVSLLMKAGGQTYNIAFEG